MFSLHYDILLFLQRHRVLCSALC